MKRLLYVFPVCLVLLVCSATLATAAKDNLTIGITYSPRSLDPHLTIDAGTMNVLNQMYDTLVRVDDKGDIVPCIAEKWEVLEDGALFRFTLKKGVKFHNGDLMTADDVVFSFKRAVGPAGNGIKALSMYLVPDSIKKIDEKTVEMRTTLALGNNFLASLSHPWGSILSEKYVTAAGKDFGLKPIGTGKYKFAQWVSGDRVVYDRFDDYHGEKAKLKQMIFRIVVEASSRTIELESGAVDIIMDPARVDVARIKSHPNLDVVFKPGSRVYYLSFDVNTPPYNDVRVRKAMNMVVDRIGISKTVFMGHALPSTGVVTSAVKYSKTKETPIPEIDYEKAKQLLKEAGYPNGFKGEIMTPDRTEVVACATILQNNFKNIGIDLAVQIYEYGAFSEGIRKRGHPPFVNAWYGGEPTLDPFFIITPAFNSNVLGSTNRSFLADKKVDELLDKGAILPDGDERKVVYGELWDYLNDILPWIVYAEPNSMYGINKKLRGVNFASGSINYYADAYFVD